MESNKVQVRDAAVIREHTTSGTVKEWNAHQLVFQPWRMS
jgi:hypothetical protein